jgi:hypothetical protein
LKYKMLWCLSEKSVTAMAVRYLSSFSGSSNNNPIFYQVLSKTASIFVIALICFHCLLNSISRGQIVPMSKTFQHYFAVTFKPWRFITAHCVCACLPFTSI